MVSILRNSFAMRSGELAHVGCSESRRALKVATAIEPSGLRPGVAQFDREGDVDVVVPPATVVLVVDVVAGTVEVEDDADAPVVTAAG
jgi:hypothetical protein